MRGDLLNGGSGRLCGSLTIGLLHILQALKTTTNYLSTAGILLSIKRLKLIDFYLSIKKGLKLRLIAGFSSLKVRFGFAGILDKLINTS